MKNNSSSMRFSGNPCCSTLQPSWIEASFHTFCSYLVVGLCLSDVDAALEVLASKNKNRFSFNWVTLCTGGSLLAFCMFLLSGRHFLPPKADVSANELGFQTRSARLMNCKTCLPLKSLTGEMQEKVQINSLVMEHTRPPGSHASQVAPLFPFHFWMPWTLM